MSGYRRFAAPVIRSQWATPDAAPFIPPNPNASMDGMRESAIEKRMPPPVSSYPTKKSDPLAYSGAVPLPGAAAPAAPEDDKSTWTGLTKSGIRYDESAYGPWHFYHTEAGKKRLREAVMLPEHIRTHRRDVMGSYRGLPTGYMGSPDDYEKAKAARFLEDPEAARAEYAGMRYGG